MYPVILSAQQLHKSINIKFQRAAAHKILSNGYQHHTNNLKVNVHKKNEGSRIYSSNFCRYFILGK